MTALPLRLDGFGRTGEIKGSSRSCRHVASLVIKLKRGWGCVCVRAGVLKMKMAHVAALGVFFFFFLVFFFVVDCGGGQSSSARRRKT